MICSQMSSTICCRTIKAVKGFGLTPEVIAEKTTEGLQSVTEALKQLQVGVLSCESTIHVIVLAS